MRKCTTVGCHGMLDTGDLFCAECGARYIAEAPLAEAQALAMRSRAEAAEERAVRAEAELLSQRTALHNATERISELTDLNASNQELVARAQEIEDNFADCLGEVHLQISHLTERTQSLDERLAAATALVSRVHQLENEVERGQALLERIAELEDKLNQATGKVTAAQASNRDLQAELLTARAQVGNATKRAELAENALEALRKDRDGWEARYRQADTRAQQADTRAQQAEEEALALQRSLVESQIASEVEASDPNLPRREAQASDPNLPRREAQASGPEAPSSASDTPPTNASVSDKATLFTPSSRTDSTGSISPIPEPDNVAEAQAAGTDLRKTRAERGLLRVPPCDDGCERGRPLCAESTVGSSVLFGRYPQGRTGGSQPIEWIVLSRSEDMFLLLSRFGLDSLPYDSAGDSIVWARSSLRIWLNNTFFNQAFGSSERKQIVVSVSVNEDNPRYGTPGGEQTNDRVLLPSSREVELLLDSREKRITGPTSYAVRQGAAEDKGFFFLPGSGAGWWWLRSPGRSSRVAERVVETGEIKERAVGAEGGMVRPLLRVSLHSIV